MHTISWRRVLAAVTLTAAACGAVLLGAKGPGERAAEPVQPRLEQLPRVDHYTTASGGELVPSVSLAHNPYRFTTLYSLKLPGLRKGNVVQAHCQLEVTNDLGFNVQLAHAMLFHRKETIVTHGARPDGRILCEYAGENITPEMHHGFRSLIGSLAVPDDGDAWVSVLIYAASDAAMPGATVRVEKGYGGLRAIVFRSGAEPAPGADRSRD
jgi:hypothetical protein